MCGILLLQGPNASARLPTCLERLQHRGPDDIDIWSDGDIALGFTRLAINGLGDQGSQPYSHGDLVGAVNGQIYNHETLARASKLRAPSECDTHVVLPLFAEHGPSVVDHLDGFYAAAIIRPATREIYCLRDHMGKKPLFVGRSGQEIFITSELKALETIDWFKPVPKGVSQVMLQGEKLVLLSEHQPVRLKVGLHKLMAEAVRKRLPRANQPVGLFLSGGLDSSIIAALAARQRDDIAFYTLGGPNSPDLRATRVLAQALRFQNLRVVPLPTSDQLADIIRKVVHATESYNPSIVSNGLSTYLLAQAARRDGLKVVLTGEGADELFGGYHAFGEGDPWRKTRSQLIHDMYFTELRRLDTCSMAHSIEARCPFLDRAVRGFSDELQFHDLYRDGQNKVILRQAFEELLPQAVLHRPKTSFDVGSGIRGQVVDYLRRNGRSERAELRDIWRTQFTFDVSNPHFHRYPVFDELIDRRGERHR